MIVKVSPAFGEAAGFRGGADVRWTPLPEAEAPTEPGGETQSPWPHAAVCEIL